MKKTITTIILGVFALSANAFDYNEAFGTYEGISANYESKPCGQFVLLDSEEIEAWNESNGYWTNKDIDRNFYWPEF